jgi:long-chain fatty acid transport protein
VGQRVETICKRTRLRPIIAAGLVIGLAAEGHAAGFALREYGFDATATAFAGASAQADAPGFLATNPAASSGVDGWDAQFTLNAIYPTSDATYSVATTSFATPTGGNATPNDFILDAYEPGLSLRARVAEDLTVGLSVSAPWGLGTRYAPTWAGRYYAIESQLLTVNIAPSIAYRVSEDLVLSAGVQAQYAKGNLSNAIDFGTIGLANGVLGSVPGAQDGFAEVAASDWGFGFVAGALWSPSPDVTLGAAYRSAVVHELSGPVDFTLDGVGIGAVLSGVTGAFVDTRGVAKLTTPAITSVGARFALTPEVSLLAEAGFTQWSVFEELRVRFANPVQPDSFQAYDWKDTWLGAVGVRYQPSQDWILRAGVAFDESPTRNATRDPRIPDSDRTWLAFGVHHDLTEGIGLQLGYARLMFPAEPIGLSATAPGNAARGNLIGRTDADADMISFQLTVRPAD